MHLDRLYSHSFLVREWRPTDPKTDIAPLPPQSAEQSDRADQPACWGTGDWFLRLGAGISLKTDLDSINNKQLNDLK